MSAPPSGLEPSGPHMAFPASGIFPSVTRRTARLAFAAALAVIGLWVEVGRAGQVASEWVHRAQEASIFNAAGYVVMGRKPPARTMPIVGRALHPSEEKK